MEFKIEKMVVAADEEGVVPASSIADSIAALRTSIEGGSVDVSPDGSARPSVEPTEAMSTIDAATDGIAGKAQATTMDDTNDWKAVPKATVAANDSSVADAISSLREQLANGENTMVNSDGTIYNPGTPATASSIANGDSFKPVPKATVAAQWYQTNPDLQKAEIAAMADIKPDAKWGYLPNGKMYWQISIHPVNVMGERKDWTFLAVYDEDHPQKRWGGSVKYYPVKPNYDEMCQRVQRSSVTPKHIPHLLRDDEGQIYMCTQDRNRIEDSHKAGGLVTTAATGLRFAMRWVNVFELGLLDQKTWTMFQHEGEI